MRCRPIAALQSAFVLVALSLALPAHGGGITLPPAVPPPPPPRVGSPLPSAPGAVPAPTGRPTPTTGAPAPATPGPAGPATGRVPAPAAGAGRGPATPRGLVLDDDYSRWEYWWELNKAPFLRRTDATAPVVTSSDDFYLGASRRAPGIDTLRPVEADILHEILPALQRAIDTTDQRSVVNSCLMAIAKIGRTHADFDLLPVFASRLQAADQEVRETAALALGICGVPDPRFLALLVALACDQDAGRRACGRATVEPRQRAYACYGLGLLARGNKAPGFQRTMVDALRQVLNESPRPDRNVEVAALNALGQLQADRQTYAGQQLIDEACQLLLDWWQRPLGPGDQLIQAHCPPALARLLGNDHPRAAECRRLFAAELAGKVAAGRTNPVLAQSCALALGRLCQPCATADAEHLPFARTLLECWHAHKDAQTRAFAILALGQIGGGWVRPVLLDEFAHGNKTFERQWLAMAIGRFAAGRAPAAEPELGSTLAQALGEVKNADSQAAIAVALGLCRYAAAAPQLRQLLQQHLGDDQLAGYLAVGLALLDDRSATDELRAVLQRSSRRPLLLKQVTLALGRLGDRSVAMELIGLLGEGDVNTSRLNAIAGALGAIRDRRSIAPLVHCLFDASLPALARAFAAEALGEIAARDELPWNSRYGLDINYRAAVETLNDPAMGILSLL
ncbi:MAG TPA: hypothetical protein VK348_05440 [Planctomycetota bacterium]|nr:hypothetical protein [Planctomycetota bacterium]